MNLTINLSPKESRVSYLDGDAEFYQSFPQLFAALGAVFNLAQVQEFFEKSIKKGRKPLTSKKTTRMGFLTDAAKTFALVEIRFDNLKGVGAQARFHKKDHGWESTGGSVTFNDEETSETAVKFLLCLQRRFNVTKAVLNPGELSERTVNLTIFTEAMQRICEGVELLKTA